MQSKIYFFQNIFFFLIENKNIYKLPLAYSQIIMYNTKDYIFKGVFVMEGFFPIILIVAMVAFFYFGMIRPQKKQERAQNDMRNNLAVGDEITTIGGIIGKIVSIKEETCVIESAHDRTKIRILKTAVSRVDVKAEDAED